MALPDFLAAGAAVEYRASGSQYWRQAKVYSEPFTPAGRVRIVVTHDEYGRPLVNSEFHITKRANLRPLSRVVPIQWVQ